MTRGTDYKKFAVLYVDDEAHALKYFPRLFGEDFRTLTASSVAEAKALIEREGDTIGVVITDQRMPEATGVELLSWLRVQRPRVVRILTTAYSDLDSAIEAVNSGAIFRYVVKPWENRDLRGILLQAMDYHIIARERDLLLREKLTVLQRMVVMDRVRSFAVLAAGLANRIRNPMLALKAFLDHAPARPEHDAEDPHVQWGDLWKMAQDESQRILGTVQDVVRRTIDPGYAFTARVPAAELLAGPIAEASAAGVSADVVVDPAVAPLTVDRAMATRLFSILLGRMTQLGLAGPRVRIAVDPAEVWGAPGVRIRLTGSTGEWTAQQMGGLFAMISAPSPVQPPDGGSDLLAAYFIAFHHAGDLRLNRRAPDGPGIDVLLPYDPASRSDLPLESGWVERVFTIFDE